MDHVNENEDNAADLLNALNINNDHPPRQRSSIVKLRMEGIPRWPKPGYKFYQWQYDWEAGMALLGIREIIKANVNDETIFPADDALAARYLVASITNTHVSAYIASNFASQGRAAYEWLEEEYGISTMRQSDLRAELDEKSTMKSHSDPRLVVILFEKLANRLTPPPSNKEKSEILLGKISTSLPDVGTLITATTDLEDFASVKSKFVKLIRDRQRDQIKNLTSEKGKEGIFASYSDNKNNADHVHANRPKGDIKKRTGNAQTRPKEGGKDYKKKENKPNGDRKEKRQCVQCASWDHVLRECPGPVVKCDHPACGQQHMREFCWFDNPHLIKSQPLREKFEVKIRNWKREQGNASNYFCSEDLGEDQINTNLCTQIYATDCDIQEIYTSQLGGEYKHSLTTTPEKKAPRDAPTPLKRREIKERESAKQCNEESVAGKPCSKEKFHYGGHSFESQDRNDYLINRTSKNVQAPTAPGPRDKVLILFSGPYHASQGISACLKTAHVECVQLDNDESNGGDRDDLLNDKVFQTLLERVKRGEFGSIFAAPPCSTFSISRFIGSDSSADGGAPIVRTREHPTGVPDVPATHKKELRVANQLVLRTCTIIHEAWKLGSEFAIENPADRGDPRMPHLYQFPRHAPIWEMPPMVKLEHDCGAGRLTFAQCQIGGDRQKYTTLLCSQKIYRELHKLENLVCDHKVGSHEPSGGIFTEGVGWNSKLAAQYPQNLNKILAAALIPYVKPSRKSEAAKIVGALTELKTNDNIGKSCIQHGVSPQSVELQSARWTDHPVHKLAADASGNRGGHHNVQGTSKVQHTSESRTATRKQNTTRPSYNLRHNHAPTSGAIANVYGCREEQTKKIKNSVNDDDQQHAAIKVHTNSMPTAQHNRLIIDSGASASVMNNAVYFKYIDPAAKISINVGTNDSTQSNGVGTISVLVSNELGDTVRLERSGVLYCKNFGVNVLSVRREVRDHKTTFKFDPNGGAHQMLLAEGNQIIPFDDDGSIYSLPITTPLQASACVHTSETGHSIDEVIHSRFGHLNFEARKQLPRFTEGLPAAAQQAKPLDPCEVCLLTKQKKSPAQASLESERHTKFGDCISSDTCGPFPKSYEHGYVHLINFCDHATGWFSVYGLPSLHGDHVFEAFKSFIADMSTADSKVKVWLTDGYTSFLTDEIKNYCKTAGIQKRHIVAYNSNSNAISERAWATIMGTTRALIKDANYGAKHWFVAAQHAAYLHNRIPRMYDDSMVWKTDAEDTTKSGYVSGKSWDSPYCRVYGRKPDVTMIKKFGSVGFAMIPKEIRDKKSTQSKLIDVSREGFYCGIATNQKGFILYAPKHSVNKYITSRNCKFDEQRHDEAANTADKDPTWDFEKVQSTPTPHHSTTKEQDSESEEDVEEPINIVGGVNDTNLEENSNTEGGANEENSQTNENTEGGANEENSQPNEENAVGGAQTPPENSNESNVLPANPLTRDRPARKDEKRCGNRAHAGEERCNRPFYHNGPHSWEMNDISWENNLCQRPSTRLRSSVARTVGVREHRANSENEDDQETTINTLTTDCHDEEYSNEAPTFTPESPPFNCVALATATGKTRYFHSPEGMSNVTVPKNYREARKHKDWDKFEAAMQVEMENHKRHGTWILKPISQIPHNRRICKSTWVYDCKRNMDGSVKKYKARFVACGYSQREGYDYYAQHAFTIRMETIRLLLTVAAERDWGVHNLDIRSAYLYADIEDGLKVYIDQPKHFEKQGPRGEEMVCQLVRALYGTKQGATRFEQKLRGSLNKIGCATCEADPGLHIFRQGSEVAYIMSYVDDLIVVASCDSIRNHVFKEVRNEYETTDPEELEWCLGIRVKRDRRIKQITLDQSMYIKDVLHRFLCPGGQDSARHRSIPCSESILSLPLLDKESEEVKEHEENYRALVGCLLWIAGTTRPDIAYSVSMLSRFVACAGREHYKAAIQVLQYLMGTIDYKLKLGGPADSTYGDSIPDGTSMHGLVAFTDASFGDEKPMGGYLLTYHASPISWAAKKLTCTPLSSCESEWLAATTATVALMFMREVLTYMGPEHEPKGPTHLLCDNKAATQLSENVIGTKGMKHIIRRVAWLKEIVNDQVMKLKFVSGEVQLADIYTKPLAATRFHKLRRCLINNQ